MVRFIHISDVHIGATFEGASFQKTFALKRSVEVKETFFKALHYVKDNNIDLLLITGDLFDYDYLKYSEIMNVFHELNQLQTHVCIIAGNHEPIKQGSFWEGIQLHDNIHIFPSTLDRLELPTLNVDIYGQSWDKYYYKEDQFDTIEIINKDRFNILMAHGDIYNKKSDYMPLNKQHLKQYPFDYIALGHIHKHDFIEANMAYPGSLEPLSFKETGQHGFIMGTLDKKNTFTFIPFSKREFKVIDLPLTGDYTEQMILQMIRDIDDGSSRKTNMYRIVFSGRYQFGMNLSNEYLQELISNDFAYVEIVNQASYDYDIDQLRQVNKDNIIGKYIDRFLEIGIDTEIQKEAFLIGLEELLTSKEGY